MERIVDRSELYSQDSSPEPSSRYENVKNLFTFKFIEHTAPQIEQHVEQDEDEMDFCLFAPTPGTSKDAQTISKVRLRSPSPLNAEPGLENPHRDRSFYFTNPLSPEEQQRFDASAVSGRDVQARCCSFCPGSSYAWKVLQINATKSQALVLAKAAAVYDDFATQDTSKRKRPGKKLRIKTRTKLALAKAAQEQDLKAAELKEAAEREKRTRRNREKKAKKKSREKAKKAAGAVESDGGEEDDASSQPG